MKRNHSLCGSLMSLNEDNQHQDRKPPVIDDQKRTQHVKHSPRKYQHDDHTEQIHTRQSVNNDINKNGYHQLEGDKNSSSRSTDDINKMMCNLLLHQSTPDVEIQAHSKVIHWNIIISCLYLQKLWRRKLVIHMVDWCISLSFQRKKQRKRSNIAFSSHQKGGIKELNYCWNNIVVIHTGFKKALNFMAPFY